MDNKRGFWFTAAMLAIIFSITVFARWGHITSQSVEPRYNVRWWNEEVVTHTTNILMGYEQSFKLGIDQTGVPSGPLVRDEKTIKNRINIENNNSNQTTGVNSSPFLTDRFNASVYISFPAWPFLAMAGLMTVLNIPFDVVGVRLLGVLLQGITAFLMATFLWQASKNESSGLLRGSGAFMAGLVYLISNETWHSSVASVWAHHIAQPVFMLLALSYAFIPRGWKRLVALTIFATLSPAFEWSGYIITFAFFSASVTLFWLSTATDRNHHLKDALAVSIGAVAALSITAIHYIWAIGLDVWLDRITVRISDRAGTGDSIWLVIFYEIISAGPWMLITALLLIFWRRTPEKLAVAHKPAAIALLCLSIGVIENAILRGHAVVYSFDSYKLICVVGLAAGWLTINYLKNGIRKGIPILSLMVILGALLSWVSWNGVYGQPRRAFDDMAYRLAGEIREKTPSDSLPVVIPDRPPGTDAWLGESIITSDNRASAIEKALERGAKKVSIFIMEKGVYRGHEVFVGVVSSETINITDMLE